MFRKINDFVELWKNESDSTLKMFDNLSDEKLNQKINNDVRTLGRLSWHIVQTLSELINQIGLSEKDDLKEMPIPNSLKEIKSTYNKLSEKLLSTIQRKWNDEDLNTVIELYGERWSNSRILGMLVNHEIHHRGQLTILMRLNGLKVPGVYGPSKEEWVNYGVDPQE